MRQGAAPGFECRRRNKPALVAERPTVVRARPHRVRTDSVLKMKRVDSAAMRAHALFLASIVAILTSCGRDPQTPAQTQGGPASRSDAVRLLEARLEGLTETLLAKDAEVKRLTAQLGTGGNVEFRNRPGEAFYAGGAVLIARDPATGDLGWLAVSICPAAAGQMVSAESGVGAITTLGVPNFALQQSLLGELRAGKTPAQLVAAAFPEAGSHRNLQLGAFGMNGPGAAFHGLGLHKESGSADGKDCFALGCEIVTPDLPQLICVEFTKAASLPFPERFLAAMREARLAPLRAPNGRAGIATSSSDRPILSAALVVLRKNGSLDGTTDRFVDLRVDLAAEPIAELDKVYRAWERASLVARLKGFLKEGKGPDDPRTKSDRAWLDRLRAGG